MRLALVSFWLILATGCATTDLPPAAPGPATAAIEQDRYHVRIKTHDGIELAATVYQPAIEPGETAPLIVTTHGYAGFRAKRPFSIYGKTMITGEAAIEAWRQGYWVVFYEQRGWGGSGGNVEFMAPDKEVKDVSTVIDWSLEHLPAIRHLPDGKPAIGMIGESYGGGAQTLAAFQDDRLQALVPVATWHDLNALAPHKHQKTAWGAYMFFLGAFSSRFDTGFTLKKPMRSAFSGTVSDDATDLMYERSPAFFCDRGDAPKADALFVQGFRDTVFPLQEALKNQDCWENGGRDARVMAIQGGHILPWPVQKWSGKPFFNTDEEVACGDYQATLVDTVVDWWDEKLKGEAPVVPDTCVTLDYESGLAEHDFPEVSESYPIPKSKVHIPWAGMFDGFMIPADVTGDVLRAMFMSGADRRFLEPNGGFGRPKFIPVYIAHENEVLSGVPRIDLRLDGTASKFSTRVFVGVGVQHANRRRVHVVSEQLTPLPKKGFYDEELPAISTPLAPGDRVGLVVYGYTWQYFFNPSYWWSQARVSGKLDLPVMEVPED
ncbi:MAG: CocE/NonD family hydrolase [Alcanivoracaceae bacterium]|nr:CocE/NonD family hydrolase [Alcanivoracaceae bacterium]